MSEGVRRPATMAYDVLSPAPDGVTVSFMPSQRYRLGSVAVWLNGMRLPDNNIVAQDGLHIVLDQAPQPGDTLEAKYTPA